MAAQINNSVQLVAQWDSFASPLLTKFLFNMLAPDNRIYISTAQGTNIFHYIESPDLPGTACNVVQNSFFLPTRNISCMPNEPNFSLGPLTGSACDSLRTSVDYAGVSSSILIYPVPSKNRLYIDGIDSKVYSFNILNSIGQCMNVQKNTNEGDPLSFNISQLEDGFYTLIVLTEKGNVIRKFIKEK